MVAHHIFIVKYDNFPNRLSGRDTTQNWLARSLDLTQFDLFVGLQEKIVYNATPTTPDDMRSRIREDFHNIPPNVVNSLENSVLFDALAQAAKWFSGNGFHLIVKKPATDNNNKEELHLQPCISWNPL